MTDTRARIPTMEWRALPSEAMMVCLRRLDEVGGYLHHSGMFKGRGYITETGRQVARTNTCKEAP